MRHLIVRRVAVCSSLGLALAAFVFARLVADFPPPRMAPSVASPAAALYAQRCRRCHEPAELAAWRPLDASMQARLLEFLTEHDKASREENQVIAEHMATWAAPATTGAEEPADADANEEEDFSL